MHDRADLFCGQVVLPGHHGGAGAAAGDGLNHSLLGEFLPGLFRGEIFRRRVEHVGGESLAVAVFPVAHLAPILVDVRALLDHRVGLRQGGSAGEE